MYYLIIIAIAVLFAHIAATSRRKVDLLLLSALLAVGFGIAFYGHYSATEMLLGILIFRGVVSTFGSRLNYVFFAISVLYVVSFSGSVSLLSLAMFLGFLSKAHSFAKRSGVASLKKEERRDLIQICSGVVLVAVLVFLSYDYARLFIMLAMLLGALVSNYAMSNPKRGTFRLLNSLERGDAAFGQGAMWLALGSLVAIIFLNSGNAVVLLAAIFIGDAAATIIGMRYGKIALPYNKKKSLLGSMAYFAVTLVVAFPLLGYVAILVSFIAALVESLPRHIDDNFDTAAVLAALMLLLGYAGLI